MAEIVESGGGGEKGGKKRPKKGSARIDMTPMVDLGFLLLTFFVLTSTFAKPKVMSLTYPAKEETKEKPKKVKNGITFIVSDDRVFYYKGQFYPAGSPDGPPTQLTETNFGPEGVRKILLENNKYVLNKITEYDGQFRQNKINDSIHHKKILEAKGDTQALKVLVKTDMKAKTRNFIDMIDELYIAQVGVIAPVDITKSEQELLDAKLKQ